ncbi:MAG: branched-chain-amino-acid transaminase [Methylomonas sp.]|jgi:branched-chain amino acid aminotransferase|uniref:branched-chain-amino-acid transaminase n=1 Tax=Methylomonas sp. TaxID=418 RepID=UPI0025D98FB2|nr:branched-chain-amino-acid transaminase [Methylomonas sp.]MCK9605784.1 branched-chain-amino-acid transaminase [Methylomonas sp.]
MNEKALCWLNGELMPAEQACIPVNDHGLLYGDGVFEGIRFYKRRAFRLQRHLQRLQMSARAIALAIPRSNEELTAVIERLIDAFADDDGYIRLMVTRGPGSLGLNPKGCSQPNVIVIADQLCMVDQASREQGARLIVSSVRRLPVDSLDPRIKSLNYLNHILAKIEANHAGVDEAVLLNAQGRVAEGTADNIFIVRNACLLTPPCSEGALEGITREMILALADAAGIKVRVQPLGVYDLYAADECFLTGTGAELIPVASIDCRSLPSCPGPVFQSLQLAFQRTIDQECGGE